MGFLDKAKQRMINKAADVVAKRFKADILQLLGEDAREADVKIVSQYFDEGLARNAAEEALKGAGVI